MHITLTFYSSKNEEITLPHEFIFVYLVFQWGDIIEKVLAKAEVRIKYKEGGCR